jgi:hypothetical protein
LGAAPREAFPFALFVAVLEVLEVLAAFFEVFLAALFADFRETAFAFFPTATPLRALTNPPP